jgi:hypothetical protein
VTPTKRGDSIERPNPWKVIAADGAAAKGWDRLVIQFPSAADGTWVAITSDPRHHDQRQHQLKGSLGHTRIDGRQMEQWQHESTASARVRYAIDDKTRTLWITDCGTGHPKDTDARRRRKRG